jgi:hypothetical protein
VIRFFIDENLQGKRFVEPLRVAGLNVTTATDLGLRGVPDAQWIPQVALEGFVVLTGDTRVRLVPAEKLAVVRARARIVAVRVGGDKTLERIARNVINSRHVIERFDVRNEAPWFAVLSLPTPKDFELSRSGRLRKVEL